MRLQIFTLSSISWFNKTKLSGNTVTSAVYKTMSAASKLFMVDKSVEDCKTLQASGKEKTAFFSDISSANSPSSRISIHYVDYNTTENIQSKKQK